MFRVHPLAASLPARALERRNQVACCCRVRVRADGAGAPVTSQCCTMELRGSPETDPDDLSRYHPGSAPHELQARKKEQEKLSGVVKSVHRKLRKKYIEGILAL